MYMKLWFTILLAVAATVALAAPALAQSANAPQERLGKRPLRYPDRLQPGDAAPDFSLPTLDGKRTVALSEHRGRPVALVFGSYT